jgi:hypothetical protein
MSAYVYRCVTCGCGVSADELAGSRPCGHNGAPVTADLSAVAYGVGGACDEVVVTPAQEA